MSRDFHIRLMDWVGVRGLAFFLLTTALVLPAEAADKVTVQQFEQAVAAAQAKPDKDAAQVIAGLAGKGLDVQMQPSRDGEIRHSLGVPTLANSVLGIEGRVPLHAGLSNVVAWLTGSTR